MIKKIKLANFVEAEDDVEIAQWYKKEGESFDADEKILEVMAEKASLDVVLGVSGKLIKIFSGDGEIVSLDDEIAEVEVDE